ncbi:MAG: 3-methyl-2-oxobutanoate hydroxymethyltransferase [Verrucomicrobiota bacterium]
MASPSPHSLLSRLKNPISAITAYDFPTAKLVDEAGVQLILVGDSLGMVVAGNPDTTTVTLDHMVYHTEMVSRGVTNAVIVSDLPIHTYDTPEDALGSSRRLIEAGAEAVKLEGGLGQLEKVRLLSESEIPVCAHIGMLPQRVVEEGGYRKKGKEAEEAKRLLEAALALEANGAFAIVLESMVPSVATEITEALEIPTIGIGAGDQCDGQIRVLHDVIGGYPWFVPPFAKVYGNVAEVVRDSVSAYVEEIES